MLAEPVGIDRRREARPARSGVVLGIRVEERVAAARAAVDPRPLAIPVHPGESGLGAFLSADRVLLRSELCAPLRLALHDLLAHGDASRPRTQCTGAAPAGHRADRATTTQVRSAAGRSGPVHQTAAGALGAPPRPEEFPVLHARTPVALSVLLAALALRADAAPAPNDLRGQMDEIFFLSGLEAQLDVVGESLGAAIAPQVQHLPPAQGQALESAVLREFGADALQREVEKHLERAYQPQHAARVLQWLRSPTGRRIAKLDLAAAKPEGAAALERYARNLGADPPPATRVSLIRQLDAATGMTDFTVDAALTSALATALGANGALPPERRGAESDIRAAVEAQRIALRPEIEMMITASMLYSYQSLGDGELLSYIDFSNSEAGHWYHESVKRALLNTLEGASTRVGRAVAATFSAAEDPVPASPAH